MQLNHQEHNIITAIQTDPKYRCMNDELKIAKKLEKAGLLQSVGNKMFSITRNGEKVISDTLP